MQNSHTCISYLCAFRKFKQNFQDENSLFENLMETFWENLIREGKKESLITCTQQGCKTHGEDPPFLDKFPVCSLRRENKRIRVFCGVKSLLQQSPLEKKEGIARPLSTQPQNLFSKLYDVMFIVYIPLPKRALTRSAYEISPEPSRVFFKYVVKTL